MAVKQVLLSSGYNLQELSWSSMRYACYTNSLQVVTLSAVSSSTCCSASQPFRACYPPTQLVPNAVSFHCCCCRLLQARFQQVDFRLRYLMHADTASLMEIAADPGASRSFLQMLLPDALLWGQHMKQFALMRNEGRLSCTYTRFNAGTPAACCLPATLPPRTAHISCQAPSQHWCCLQCAVCIALRGLACRRGTRLQCATRWSLPSAVRVTL